MGCWQREKGDTEKESLTWAGEERASRDHMGVTLELRMGARNLVSQ